MNDFLNYELGGNRVIEYIIISLIVIGITVFVTLVKSLSLRFLKNRSENTENKFDDILVHIFEELNWYFFFFLSSYYAILYLNINETVERVILTLLILTITFLATRAITELIVYLLTRTIFTKQITDKAFKDFASIVISILIWTISLLTVLQNLGFNVTALATGLGISGIAIAFALQNVLSDIFASFSIYFDKPFKTGDAVNIDGNIGTVKKVGIKSTRIDTLEGEEMIISNKDLTTTRIRNYKRMPKRRIVLQHAIDLRTPLDKIKKIPGWIETIIKNEKDCDFDRSNLYTITPNGYLFESVFYIPTADYNEYMRVQEQVLLNILETFNKNNVSFALPSQFVLVDKQGKS